MRKTLVDVLELFQACGEAKRQLHGEMDTCLRRIYRLARGKSVTARPKRDAEGLLRRIQFVLRTKGRVEINGQKYPVLLRLRAPINAATVRDVIRDMANLEEWLEVYQEARALNARHPQVAIVHRDLRAALANKYAPSSSYQDRQQAAALQRSSTNFLPRDQEALVGAIVHDRKLADLEHQISDLVRQWKDRMKDAPFEPMIRWRESGPLRLSWAYVDRFYDAQHTLQVRSHEIPGGLTDLWLRKNYPTGGAGRRKEILTYAVPLRKLTREYSGLLVHVGRFKARVRHALFHEVGGGRPVAGIRAV